MHPHTLCNELVDVGEDLDQYIPETFTPLEALTPSLLPSKFSNLSEPSFTPHLSEAESSSKKEVTLVLLQPTVTEPASERVSTHARTRVQLRQQAPPLAGFSNTQQILVAPSTQTKTQAQAVSPVPSPLATQQPIVAKEPEKELTSESLSEESPAPFAHSSPEPISPLLPSGQLTFQTIAAAPLTPAPPLL